MLKKASFVSLLLLSNACGSSMQSASGSSLSASESASPSIFLDEAAFAQDFDARVLPLIAQGKSGFFDGVKGAKLYHQAFENPKAKGKIVIVGGFTESTIKYRELIYNFYQAGYSVYTYDHRGQGASTRFVEDREMTYVESWDDYIADLKIFVSKVVPANQLPTLIFSHSMGGAIVADALTSTPNLARAAVISSPALALKQAAGKGGALLIPSEVAAATAVNVLRQGKKYGLYQEALNRETWTLESASTSSPERFSRYKADSIAADQAMGGASWNWQYEVLKMNTRFSKNFTMANAGLKAESLASKVTTPILMGQAGLDTLALASAQDDYCAYAKACNVGYPKDAKGRSQPIRFANSKHEIYNEKEEIRNEWIKQILAFYANNLK